ncbi:unnamed protein product [Camellia sinensis]
MKICRFRSVVDEDLDRFIIVIAVFVNARLHVSGGALGGGRMVEESSSVAVLDTAAGVWCDTKSVVTTLRTGRYSADAAGGDATVELTRRYRHAVAAIGDLRFIYGGLRGEVSPLSFELEATLTLARFLCRTEFIDRDNTARVLIPLEHFKLPVLDSSFFMKHTQSGTPGRSSSFLQKNAKAELNASIKNLISKIKVRWQSRRNGLGKLNIEDAILAALQTFVMDVLLLDPLTFGFKLAENSTRRAKLSSPKESINQVQSPLSKGSVLAHDMTSMEVLLNRNILFGTSLMRKVKSCFTCYKPTDRGDGGKSLKYCMYYSEMSAEERNEQITSAISYCKVANFEYIDEVEAEAEKEARKASTENKTTTNNPDRASYWEELLKDRYEVQKVEEFNAMGKGNRSRKQMVSVEDEDLASLEDVSSEGEDNNYEAELTDEETATSGILTGRRSYRKKIRVDSAESLPLMEGEGRSFRVKGFNQNQRAAFVQIMMRFGVGEFDWAEYGTLFLTHIAEDITNSPTFSDGVPKEGLRIEDVLVRIAVLLLIRDKVKAASEKPGTPLFLDDIVSRFPGLKSGS